MTAPKGGNVQLLALAEDHFPDVVVVVVRFKAHPRGEGKEITEAVRRFLSERIFAFRGLQRGIEFHRFADGIDDIVEIIFHNVGHSSLSFFSF